MKPRTKRAVSSGRSAEARGCQPRDRPALPIGQPAAHLKAIRGLTVARQSAPDAHFVYIVRCADGSLYTGYARDPRARVKVHNLGKGARYTLSRRPVRLVYKEACESKGQALSREHAIKRLSRDEKRALIRRTRQKLTTVTPGLRGSRRKARTEEIAAKRR